jgi:hypothetical protein
MAHFAELDNNNRVIRVIALDNDKLSDGLGGEDELVGINYCKSLFGQETNWIQTSYNNSFRGNFAGEGYIYDPEKNIFMSVYQANSWLTSQMDEDVPLNNASLLIDGFPRSGTIFCAYVMNAAFPTVYRKVGYTDMHTKESFILGPEIFNSVVIVIRNPSDSIRSWCELYNQSPDKTDLLSLAQKNLNWFKILKEYKNKVTVITFDELTTNLEITLAKVSAEIDIKPTSFDLEEVKALMLAENWAGNLPSEERDLFQVDLSDTDVAEIIQKATAIYNEIIG